MTGLLQRLAARATGSAWTVRTDARLPFHPAPVEQVQDVALPMATAAPGSPASVRHPQEAAPPDRHVDPPRAAAPTPTTDAIERRPVQPPRTPPAAPVDDATTQPPAMRPAASSRAPVATPATAPAARFVAATQAVAASIHARTDASAGPKPSPAAPRGDPAPLMPLQAQGALQAGAPSQAQPRAPAAVQMAAPSGPGADTEVHIHIGRIDVTAVHEAPRPKARAREHAPLVSLDAYLAARSKP
ncbi:hypothetical protein QTH97_30390 [Variovorax sp. J22R24]|uniref:hypothetical protein n=1 Tax=Variovorax gracilis TaxID=3053502 RepID=UPI0025767A86|nr:hypothetical protein [Variovorax sp. J22R24]MDM0109281.1 hypothetical protein [Variovorax sp. J22R24]